MLYTWTDLKQEIWSKTARDCQYNVKKLAGTFGCSTRKLERDFRQHLQTTPRSFLRKLQLEAAIEIIVANPDTPTKVIAIDLFFSSSAYFCAEFKKHTGLTPQQFAQQVKKRREMAGPTIVRMTGEAPTPQLPDLRQRS